MNGPSCKVTVTNEVWYVCHLGGVSADTAMGCIIGLENNSTRLEDSLTKPPTHFSHIWWIIMSLNKVKHFIYYSGRALTG